MLLRLIVMIVFCVGMTACASVPDVNPDINPAPGSLVKPEIIGADGPFTENQSKKILEKLSIEGHDTDNFQRHLAIEQAVTGSPLIAGNRTRVLQNGPESFRAIFKAIRQANDNINLEFYILEDIESDGIKLSDLLAMKRQEGVVINLIYDSYGSAFSGNGFFDRLNQIGVKLISFSPLDPLEAKNSYAPNDRDHRKLVIADGSIAIMGGVNLSKNYLSNPVSRTGINANPDVPIRDTDVEIEGPAVAQLQMLFFDHWNKQKGPVLTERTYFPPLSPKGSELIRIIGSTSDDLIPRYYATLLLALRSSKKNIWLTTAYFVPTRQEKEELIHAARRGVDVRLLLPGQSDSPRALAVQHSNYEDLLEAGVKIYESQSEELHSKTVVIDGVWSTIGSSNFDHRSVLFNDEIDAVILGETTGQEFERIFIEDINKARPIDSASWGTRSIYERFDEIFSRIWQSLL